MSAVTDEFAADVQALTEAMRATCADPANAISILAAMVATPLPTLIVPSQIAAQQLTAATFRRAALASMALACADYQPASSTEAQLMIARVGTLFDTDIVAAADAGQLASYNALRDMRQAVIADLRARSAALPALVTISLPGNLPSLTMAYRLYGDATREPGMVARADPVHPGFMPSSFEALSS
jgi:prophage DNA circulation protein